jgi:tetratricopeptide (TPR) repeat protein
MASRSVTFIAPLAALAISVGSAVGQQSAAPVCRHLDYRSNFRLNGVQQHLTQARSTRYEDVRRSRIADATRLLGEAARAGGVDQATLWYMFAQLYVLNHDLVGADSAFTKVEATTDPECKRELARERRNEWVGPQNQGVELMNAGNMDSALALFRMANVIYRTEPYAYLNMASIFIGRNQDDSAIVYFRLAARSSQDRRFDEARETALFNAARLVHRSALDTANVRAEAQRRSVPDSVVKITRLRDAEAAYREVLQLKPRDLPAQASLAGVLTLLHNESEARQVYDSMLAHADSMDAFDLVDAGTALFRQGRFDLAARATEAGLAKDRCFRDGLYNLANIYLAAKDTVKLLAVSRRLVAQDSMNRASLQMLARAWQDHGDKDSTLRVLQRAEALPWEMASVRFEPGDSSASLHAMVTNLQQQALKGFPLTVQFLNGACDVVATQSVDLPDLNANGNAGQSYDFTLTGSGRGIVAWKYKTD